MGHYAAETEFQKNEELTSLKRSLEKISLSALFCNEKDLGALLRVLELDRNGFGPSDGDIEHLEKRLKKLKV